MSTNGGAMKAGKASMEPAVQFELGLGSIEHEGCLTRSVRNIPGSKTSI